MWPITYLVKMMVVQLCGASLDAVDNMIVKSCSERMQVTFKMCRLFAAFLNPLVIFSPELANFQLLSMVDGLEYESEWGIGSFWRTESLNTREDKARVGTKVVENLLNFFSVCFW